MHGRAYVLFVVASALIFAGELWSGSPKHRAHVTMADTKGHKFILTLGIDLTATDGFDFALGEIPIPPPPPLGNFEVRFLDRSSHRRVPGDGSYVDIRPFRSETQIDTFVVCFQAAENALPLHFSWNSDARGRFESMRVVYLLDGKETVLEGTRVNAFALSDLSPGWLKIILFGTRSK